MNHRRRWLFAAGMLGWCMVAGALRRHRRHRAAIAHEARVEELRWEDDGGSPQSPSAAR